MNYYIVNNASRASRYGVGTYLRQLDMVLSSVQEIRRFYIDLYADVEEFSVIKDEAGSIHYLVPAGSKIETTAYCRLAYYLISPYLDTQEVNIFHFNFFQHYPLALYLKAHDVRSRLVLVVHYFDWCFLLNGNLTKFRQILAGHMSDEDGAYIKKGYAQDRKFLCLADVVVVLSQFCRQLLVSDYHIDSRKTQLIYNGLGDKKHGIADKKERDPLLLFVGRLDHIKGVNYLVRAFQHVAQIHDDARLVIVGDGDYNECLKECKGIWHKVSFTGNISQEDLVSLYNRAMIGVLPSFHEQCSYAAIEFMMHGIPIVATDSTGLGEMLDVAPGLKVHINEEAFSEDRFITDIVTRINMLLDDHAMRDNVGAQMREQYLQKYTYPKMRSQMVEVVEECRVGGQPLLSEDYLSVIDNHMISLIHQRPEIDTDFYGMSGIGVYLWWRLTLSGVQISEAHEYKIKEYLIYYLDWLYESFVAEGAGSCCEELAYILYIMQSDGFYKTRVSSMISVLHIKQPVVRPHEVQILQNALRIINTKI